MRQKARSFLFFFHPLEQISPQLPLPVLQIGRGGKARRGLDHEEGQFGLKLWTSQNLIGHIPQKTNLQKLSLLLTKPIWLFFRILLLNNPLTENLPLFLLALTIKGLTFQLLFNIIYFINSLCFVRLNVARWWGYRWLFFGVADLLFLQMVDGFVVDGGITVRYFVVAAGGFLLAGLFLLSWLLFIGNLYNGCLLGPLLFFLNFIPRSNAPFLGTQNRTRLLRRSSRKRAGNQRIGVHRRVEVVLRQQVGVAERLRKRGI